MRSSKPMAMANLLVYYFRHDLRVADNPILHHLATTPDHGFTHLLPVYILPAHQIEVSGFLRDGENVSSPYPQARGEIGKYWRCGPHRARFIAQSVWNLKENLESIGSGLRVQPGKPGDVVAHILAHVNKEKDAKVGAVWFVGEEGTEERQDTKAVKRACEKHDVQCKVWQDEKYFIDDRDLDMKSPQDLADVFTTYRKAQEPLKTRPRTPLPRPSHGSIPPFPPDGLVPPPLPAFSPAACLPTSEADLEERLLRPLQDLDLGGQSEDGTPLPAPPAPAGSRSAHPLRGGEDNGRDRLRNAVVGSGLATRYKETRNGLVGPEFSTKLSAYLAQGCLTARQVHEALAAFEDGKAAEWEGVDGYGRGENQGTSAIRFELLWRDYMRLCSRKFGAKLFREYGFWDLSVPKSGTAASPAVDNTAATTIEPGAPVIAKSSSATSGDGGVASSAGSGGGGGGNASSSTPSPTPSNRQSPGGGSGGGSGGGKKTWKKADAAKASPDQSPDAAGVEALLTRFKRGTTGFGLVDASMRELLHTGYTSNRARQNAASLLTRRLGIDWRYGAEWYEMLLVDYDPSSNWANWQYVAGIGNDPKETRVFNPVRQAFEYDPNGDYVRMWVPEIAGLTRPENLFQVSTTAQDEAAKLGIEELDMYKDPVERITYYVDRKPPKRSGRFYVRGQRGGSASADAPAGAPRGPRGSGDNDNGNNNRAGSWNNGGNQSSGSVNRGRRGGGYDSGGGGGRPYRRGGGGGSSGGGGGDGGMARGGFRGGSRVANVSTPSRDFGYSRQYHFRSNNASSGGSGSMMGSAGTFVYYPAHTQMMTFPGTPVGPHWMMPHPGPHM